MSFVPPKGVAAVAATDFDWSDPRHQRALDEALPIWKRLMDEELLGPNPGTPTGKHIGLCRLCGEEQELTFEHFPPRSARNADRQRAFSFWSAHVAGEQEIGAVPPTGWTPMQRGIGAAVLCSKCNNERTGRRLVPAYSRFANEMIAILASEVRLEDGRLHVPSTIQLTIEGSCVGAFARQALVMLMAVSGGAALTRLWPQLYDLVLAEDGGELPVEIGLGLRLVVGGRSRASGPMIQIGEHGYRVFIEMASTPFAWDLSIGRDGDHPAADGADVSSWFGWGRTETATTTVTLPVGTVVTPYPGDFREPGEIARQAQRMNQLDDAV